MLDGECRVSVQSRKNGKPKRAFVNIPIDIAKDSQFPFKNGNKATISVDPKEKTITIKKIEK